MIAKLISFSQFHTCYLTFGGVAYLAMAALPQKSEVRLSSLGYYLHNIWPYRKVLTRCYRYRDRDDVMRQDAKAPAILEQAHVEVAVQHFRVCEYRFENGENDCVMRW
jgi:hypothetical protein